jgi:predicted DNA-binding transcriptional regulator AlpA
VSPTLAELLAHPERVADLEPSQVPALLAQLAALSLALSARLAATSEREPSANGHMLSPDEVGALLGIPREQVWRYSRRRSWQKFTRRVSRKCVRFDEAGLRAWLATQGTVR